MKALLLLLIPISTLAEPLSADEAFKVGKAIGFFHGCTGVMAAIAESSVSAAALEAKTKQVTELCMKWAIAPIYQSNPDLLKRPDSIRLMGDALRERTAWFKDQALLK